MFGTIPEVEVQRIAQFLSLTDLHAFRLVSKRCHSAAPFAKLDKHGAGKPVTPITVALGIDATDMDEDTFTKALKFDSAPSLTAVVMSNINVEYPAVKLFSQSINGVAAGNNISLYVRRPYPLCEPAVSALMNHPRVTSLDGIQGLRIYNSFSRYNGTWRQDKFFTGGPFDDDLWGSPRLQNFCDIHEIMQLYGTVDINYWVDVFSRRDHRALESKCDELRRGRFVSTLQAMNQPASDSDTVRDLYKRLYFALEGTDLDEDLQQEEDIFYSYDSDDGY